jgi:hypothetical protein
MADKVIIYCTQNGEQRVPVTVRIEWLPDGKIMPVMYWTPDHSCYEIKHIYEMTPLAFLKDRGEGLRFRVRAVVIEAPEADDNLLYTQFETYLYFTDNRYCGKNIVDSRYEHAGKEYVPVTLNIFPNGDYEILYFEVHQERYIVERMLEVEARGSFAVGGVGIWHKVDVRLVNADDDEDPDPQESVRRLAALYFEINKWFVAVKP